VYLQVTWLSEICNNLGTRILPDFLDHTYNTVNHSKSTLQWRVQGLPPRNCGPKLWTEWKYLLRKRFLISKKGRLANTSLEINMGAFFPTAFNQCRWKWEQTSPTTENVFSHGDRQRQFIVTETRTGRSQITINMNNFEWIDGDNVKFGYPLDQAQQSGATKTFSRPIVKNMYNRHKADTIEQSKFVATLTKSSMI
jgi:hypothetical protein